MGRTTQPTSISSPRGTAPPTGYQMTRNASISGETGVTRPPTQPAGYCHRPEARLLELDRLRQPFAPASSRPRPNRDPHITGSQSEEKNKASIPRNQDV
jgi:hypothetical protein